MSKLTIHMGHGKTGSSAIQSALARNAGKLEQFGLTYPFRTSFEETKHGRTGSGNGRILLSDTPSHEFGANWLLYSNEGLFHKLITNDEKRHAVIRAARQFGYDLEFVIYARDLIEHSMSAWGQYIKRALGTLDYESYVFERYRTDVRLKRWQERSQEEGFQLRIFNYQRHRERIVSHFFSQVLGLTNHLSELDIDDSMIVNRSLSTTEYEIQRQFNIALSPIISHPFVSDPLVDRSRNSRTNQPIISHQTYLKIVQRLTINLEAINRFIDSENKLLISSFEDLESSTVSEKSQTFELSSDQIRILAESISKHIRSLSDNALTSPDRKLLMSLADKIKDNTPLTEQDAESLSRIANTGDTK